LILSLLALASALGASQASPAMPGANVPAVKVDTVGYPSAWTKVAMLNSKPEQAAVVDAQGKQAYAFKDADLHDMGLDASSQDHVWQADFSALKKPGTYRIVNGAQRSDPFSIGDKVYAKASDAALRMFFFQRCRSDLKGPLAQWDAGDDPAGYGRKDGCHAQAWKDGKAFQPIGGWHDAGNFDIYVASTAPTVWELLQAYDTNHAFFDAPVIASMNGTAAIVTEANWGLDWLMSMQLPDGSELAREATKIVGEAPGGDASQDQSRRLISGIGTASTAKACAVFAFASKALPDALGFSHGPNSGQFAGPGRNPKDLAADLARRAKLAWAFLQAHPERIFVEQHGSDQPLWDDSTDYSEISQRALAAAEMWASFKDSSALDYLKSVWSDPELMPERFDHGAWGNLGRWVMIRVAHDLSFPKEMVEQAKQRIFDCVIPWRTQVESKDGYRCASAASDYYWGSNSNLLEKAQLLLEASKLDPKQFAWAKQAARDQWHWILGRNPNGFSMVTRVGHGPDRIYHLEWGGKKVPPPGYLVGGPNAINAGFLAPGAPAKAMLWDNPMPMEASGLAAHSLWHNAEEDLWEGGFTKANTWETGWWVAMEPDIYYNANLVLVAAGMQD
jgi:endoglucanase